LSLAERYHRLVILLAVRVHPGASREAVTMLDDGSVDVRLRARPIEGKANATLAALLAKRLGLPKRDVQVARGERSRQKLVEVALPSLQVVRERLAEAPG
jgi:uncharacterized protein (TIGR00251 family)